MPRPRRPGAPEPKRRSRKGCWPCKARKVKCGEEKPSCSNCRRQNESCDYSIRLNWGGRTRRSSIHSPSSQSSSLSRQSFLFPLSPPAVPHTHPASPIRPFKASGFEENTAQDEPAETLFWDAGLAGEMTIGRTYPSRLHDIQVSPTVPDQSLNPPNRTTDRASVEMDLSRGQETTTWPNFSTESAGSREDVPKNQAPNSFADSHHHPSPGTSTNMPELLNFNFPSGLVSQPISFVRPSVDAAGYALNHSPFGLDHQNSSGSPTLEIEIAGTSDCNTNSPSDSHESVSPGSLDTSLFTSGTPYDQEESPDSAFAGLNGIPGTGIGSIKHTRSNSLYSGLSNKGAGFDEYRGLTNSEKWHAYLTSVTDHYGIDCGRPDLDLGNNDDHSAIDVDDALDTIQSQMVSNVSSPRNHQAGKERGISRVSKYDYYVSAVPVDIPRYLSPLPRSLLKVPINLMYFHHFLNHTARVLVPHDCGDNPFSSVLPSMAIGDPNLLNLMLAYSASHRARLLDHPEPVNRIAHWVSNVFPSLRLALEDPQERITDSHLATAIMLLSLEVVSPSAFEVAIPWQSLLKLARDLFFARQNQIIYPGNRVGAFLTRWLGYLDILGSLSCRFHQPPLLAYYSVLNTCSIVDDWDEFAVDCLTGFTPRTGLFLMQLGSLVHQCDNERFGSSGEFLPEWKPSQDIVLKAESLISDWETLDTHAHTHERHYQDSESSDMIAVDRAFRYAGLVHLHRRVLGDSSDSGAVSKALNGLMQSVTVIRSGSAVEAGVLFPIFTAGCETQNLEQRIEIKERLEVLEGTGMKQIQNARALMQRCWDTNLPWIAFSQGEFIG
ncbi:fungal-specific transcription factor domain-containing protein [Aspergillus aurantiobrunneus]